ncbi:PIN domain-containing protein [Candidatus Microgenomates bacterium]|nr:PIN domain-containing protein [Candidatus Microgenomates bacterium]
MRILLDSDTLFALYVASDIHHHKARQIFQELLNKEKELLVTNLVVQETATVISYRFGQKQAIDFINRFNKIDIEQVFVDRKLTIKAWEIFLKQKKKGTSYIDCANIVVYKELKILSIFSFDQVYKRMGLKVIKDC